MLAELEEKHLVERNLKEHTYTAIPRLGQVDFAAFDVVREQKQHELSDIQNYAQLRGCYMEYLTSYLGDQPGYSCRVCGYCRSSNFLHIRLSESTLRASPHFLEDECFLRIEKRATD